MSQTVLYDEVYPKIYSVYHELLKNLYTEDLNTEQKHFYLQQKQELARELHQKYLIPQKTHVEVDYTDSQIQEIYMLRYSLPHALQIPWVLESLRKRNFHHLKNNLTVSLFGGGPCPEILGLRHYLNKTPSNQVNISAARFDIVPDWKWNYRSDTFSSFKSNLAGNGSDFLNSTSREWVENSDLVVIQNCLNEIPELSFSQLLINLKYIVEVMKPGALMLVIEKRYQYVEALLKNLYSELIKINNIQPNYTPKDDINIRCLNYRYVPNELIKHLFLRQLNSWLWLTNNISFHWLAISKQAGFYDSYSGVDIIPSPPMPQELGFYDPYTGISTTLSPPMAERIESASALQY